MTTRRRFGFSPERRRFLKGVAGLGAGAAVALIAAQLPARRSAAAPAAAPARAALGQSAGAGWRLTAGAYDTTARSPAWLSYTVSL